MDEVAALLDALLARWATDGPPGPGDGVVLSCVPDRAAGGRPRWELLVTRGGVVAGAVVAADPVGALRAVLDPAATPGTGTGPGRVPVAGSVAVPVPVAGSAVASGGAPGAASGVGALLRALERIAVAVPLLLDVDAAGDLAPGAGAPGWAWTVSATRWDVLVEGSVLRWGGGSAREALARALADLDDDPSPQDPSSHEAPTPHDRPPHDPPGGPLSG